jgi:hypothetical protein
MITRALVLTIFVFTAIFLGAVQQAYGQTIFDFFSPTKSDEDRKQQIYKIVELQVYNFELHDIFDIHDDLDVIELANRIFEQEKLEGVGYSESEIKLKVNNASIDLFLNSKDELAGRGNIRTTSMTNP